MLTKDNSALTALSSEVLASPPAPPAGNALVLAYNLSPEGATFNPALTIILSCDPTKLPKDVAEKDLYLAYYDGNQWQALASTVDTVAHTVSAGITHFSRYALLGKITPPALPVPSPTPSPSPTDLPAPATTSTPEEQLPPVSAPTVATPSQNTQPAVLPAPIETVAPSPTSTSIPQEPPAASVQWPLITGMVVVVAAILTGSILPIRKRRS
jgi:hypothetical protein